jgi:acyl carrier protein
MSDEFVQRIISCIAAAQHIPPESITLDSTFEELGIDSLDGLQLLFEIESEFGISISDDAARQVRSIRDMAEGVHKLLAARPA